MFVGSVFSPAYRKARQQDRVPARAENHAAVNLAIYGEDRRSSSWVFSEYKDSLERSADGLGLGRNSIEWQGDELVIRIDDQRPWSQGRVQGEIRVQARRRFAPCIDLAGNGEHEWFPVSPASPATVRMSKPGLSFEGTAYHDVNRGTRALERDFVEWDWSRLTPGTHGTPSSTSGVITYDVVTRDQPDTHHRRAFAFDDDHGLRKVDTAGTKLLDGGRAFWGVSRRPVGDEGSLPQHRRTLEDSPFYTRSLISTTMHGRPYHGVHESLRLDRFVEPVVQCMLPFRIRRR